MRHRPILIHPQGQMKGHILRTVDGRVRVGQVPEGCELAREAATWSQHFPRPEYVAVPDALLKKTKELQKYLQVSYEYALTLKAKPTKKNR